MEIMNNLITVVDTGSVELNSDVEYVRHQCAIGRKASHDVARRLLKIKREELFTVCADNFSDFCTNYFTINKATGSKLTALAERFLVDENGNDIADYDDYSISQLMECRNATTEQLALIKPTMTVKEIRDILHPKKAIADKSTDESCDTATDNDTEKKVGGIKKVEMPEPPKFEKIAGDGKLDFGKIVGDGWVIILNDKHSWHHAEIETMRGLLNFTDFLRSQLHGETIDKAVMEKVWINF